MVAADTNTSSQAASWPDGDTGDIQPPGSGGGAASGTPHAATPARPRSAAVQPGDISTLHISTLDISILHNVMNNGYGCIWTRVRVLSVLTAGDPGLVRRRLASTSQQRRRACYLPQCRPARRAVHSTAPAGESLDSGE